MLQAPIHYRDTMHLAQETGESKNCKVFSSKRHLTKTLEGYTPMDSSDPVESGGTYIKYQGETIQLSETAIHMLMVIQVIRRACRSATHMYITILLRHCQQMH